MKYKGVKKQIILFCFVFLARSLFAFEVKCTHGNLELNFNVTDAYEVSLEGFIDNNQIHTSSYTLDLSNITCKFIDLNGDKYLDIIVRFEDEEGYEPIVLINQENHKLYDATKNIKSFYVSDIFDDDGSGTFRRLGKYEVDNKKKTISFYYAFVGQTKYHVITIELMDDGYYRIREKRLTK